MLKTPLIHPQILAALGAAGHGSRILISDGNYPHWTRRGPNAAMVYANFAPGVLDAVTVLRLLVGVIPVESAHVMAPDKEGPYALKQDPPIWAPFRKELAAADGFDGELRHLGRFPFYEAGGAPDVCLNIVTGEQQIWANLLLTIGVVR